MSGFSVDRSSVDEVQAAHPFHRYGRPLFDAETLPGAVASMIIMRYPPDVTGPPHTHPEVELFFCLQGSGEVTIDDETHLVEPGTAVYVPSEATHQPKNTGNTDLELLAVLVPSRNLAAWRR